MHFDDDPSWTEIPSIYDDGAYSISGLREHFDELIVAGEEILVRATVQRIFVPPQLCPRGCVPRHSWVTDDPDVGGRRHAMLLGGYGLEPDTTSVVLAVGRQYTFRAKLVRNIGAGLADDRGVLQFVAVASETGE